MRFREIRNINVSYRRQGQIFFTLANYDEQPPRVKARIGALIAAAAGGERAYEAALRDWLIGGASLDHAALSHYVRAQTLVQMRKKIYESW